MTAPISRIMKSIIRHVTDMADGSVHPMTYHAWEARGEEDKLPKSTLIGLDGFNFDENTGLWVVRCAVVPAALSGSERSSRSTDSMRDRCRASGVSRWSGRSHPPMTPAAAITPASSRPPPATDDATYPDLRRSS